MTENLLKESQSPTQPLVEDVFTHDKVIEIAELINNPRDKSLFILLYLSGCRVSELVKRIRKKDLDLMKIRGVDFMIIRNLHTSKKVRRNRKTNPTSEELLRSIPVNLDKERVLVSLIQPYLDALSSEDILFPISRQRAWRVVRDIILQHKPMSINKFYNGCHYLRHTRTTHLITQYGFSDADLRKFFGWSDPRMVLRYSHLRWSDLAERMI